MKLELSLAETFGASLADGAKAVEFRMGRIDPYVDICTEIILDFTGIRNANSSFMNALIAGLIEQHGHRVLKLLVIKGHNPAIRVLVETAVALGLHKTGDCVTA
jgi:hypothetical protein